jgi:hypothetical protein
MLTRWTDVITDGLPDPNAKVNSARPTATGLGDGDLGMDIDFGDLDNEDWIIDDTEGAAYKDEPRVEKQKYAKELGRLFCEHAHPAKLTNIRSQCN